MEFLLGADDEVAISDDALQMFGHPAAGDEPFLARAVSCQS